MLLALSSSFSTHHRRLQAPPPPPPSSSSCCHRRRTPVDLSDMKPKQEPRKAPDHAKEEEKGAKYGECMKNHAASIGRHAVDGCREFMAGGASGTAAALLCAACGCHRSFHRRVGEHLDECSSNSST